MPDRILIVDDDDRLTAMLARFLGEHGFEVHARGDLRTGLGALAHLAPDALVLDVMLPDGDGFAACRQIRASSTVPIVMLTARGEETDRVVGLELGADDYLAKPFSPRELVARLRAVLRRTRAPAAEEVLRFGRLFIQPGARTALLDGRRCDLTSHQLDILVALARRAGRVLSREQLMQEVRGEPLEAFDRSIDVHVSRIRAAIEDDPRQPRRIVTVRGAGYVFATEQD